MNFQDEPFHGWKDADVEHAKEMQKLLYKITGHSDATLVQNTQKVGIISSHHHQ